MSKITLSDATVASVRTTINGAWLAVLASLWARLTGWHIELEDLAIFTPAILFVGAAFYRLSRFAAEKWAWLNYVLFGIARTPIYVQPGLDKLDNTELTF